DGRVAFLPDRQEMMQMVCRPDRVDCDFQVAVSAILESHRTGQPRCQLAMHLAFSGASPDRAPAHKIGDVLRRDDIEILDACRHAEIVEFEEQFAGHPQSVVDPETAVEIWIVDEPFNPPSFSAFQSKLALPAADPP